MIVMGIESSCDETAVALIERGENNRVLDEQIKSQIPLHAIYGGVVPEIASRSHYETIDYLAKEALQKTGLTVKDIDLVSFTRGPGLIGSLLVGLSFAKGLSYTHKIPLVGVDHIYAHIESAFIDNPGIEYPLIALVVSGGHTTLFYLPNKFEARVVAKTRDDAVGEIMDKIAKFFGLGYPGGPILDKLHPGGDPRRYSFTKPRMSDGSNDFSFSGYKTAVIRHPEAANMDTDSRDFTDLVASFMHSVTDYMLAKTLEGVEEYGVKSVLVAGGVSRNTLLREKFSRTFDGDKVKLYLPKPRYCTDNASMVAWLGYETHQAYPERDYFDYSLNSYSRAGFRDKGKFR